jgi:hypothetical protein
MTIGSTSSGGVNPGVLYSSDSIQREALQALQNRLTAGDLTSAQSVFLTLQNILQRSATTSRTTAQIGSQLANDLNTLGNTLQSGDLSSAQSAFSTVLNDLRGATFAVHTNEASYASQSLPLSEYPLSTVNSSNPSFSALDQTASVQESDYYSQGSLDVYA